MAPANQQANAIQSVSMPSLARLSNGRECPSVTLEVNEHACLGVAHQMNPPSAQSCNQPRSVSVRSNSPSVLKQGNTWQINIGQMSGRPAPMKSIQVNTQGQRSNGPVLLFLFDVNQRRVGQYTAQLDAENRLVFPNLPSTPISAAQLQFPNGAQPNNYVVDTVICSQTANPSTPSSYPLFGLSPLRSNLFAFDQSVQVDQVVRCRICRTARKFVLQSFYPIYKYKYSRAGVR